tara:strand:- start:720 stop:1025 length:306 start_codon:yes stop_codon:yes gene_type:complete
MEEIINKIFKDKYPIGLSTEYTKEEMTGYMMAINDIKEQLSIHSVSHCFDNEELNLIRQWFNNFIDAHPDNAITKKEWNIAFRIHKQLDMKPENRIVKNCG